jgi:hypothetical protein
MITHSETGVKFPETVRAPIDPTTGRHSTVLWKKTGNRRGGYTPNEIIGARYSDTAGPAPKDGGTYGAGSWATVPFVEFVGPRWD